MCFRSVRTLLRDLQAHNQIHFTIRNECKNGDRLKFNNRTRLQIFSERRNASEWKFGFNFKQETNNKAFIVSFSAGKTRSHFEL